MKSKRQRQSEQQPVHVGGCVSQPLAGEIVQEMIQNLRENVAKRKAEQDPYNGMNGVCCK